MRLNRHPDYDWRRLAREFAMGPVLPLLVAGQVVGAVGKPMFDPSYVRWQKMAQAG